MSASGYLLSRTFNSYAEVQDQGLSVGGLGVYDYNLTYDNAGRIQHKSETLAGTSTVWDYEYTLDGQLRTVTKDGVLVEEYGYDAGLRTSETNALRDLTRIYGYTEEDGILSAGDVTYLQDSDGFLLQKTAGSDITQYWYALTGELQTVELPTGTLIDYEYDPVGRRIAKKVNGIVTEKYLWQGMTRLLAVFDASDNLLMRFEYADGRMPVAMIAGGVTYYLAFDQVGSLRAVVDGAGNVVKQIDYDSFGNALFDSNPSFYVPFRFAGGLFDAHTGLIRFGYRDYDPDLGRWTSKDPIGFAGGDADLYGYVQNDPVNLVDPWGLYIGQMPPAPPSYNPSTWSQGQWDSGRYFIKDPDGKIWTAHPEDEGHWRHWDKQGPGGDDQGRWPNNSKKPWKGQKKLKCDQSETDPNGDTPEWTPNHNMLYVPFYPGNLPTLNVPIRIPTRIPVPVFP